MCCVLFGNRLTDWRFGYRSQLVHNVQVCIEFVGRRSNFYTWMGQRLKRELFGRVSDFRGDKLRRWALMAFPFDSLTYILFTYGILKQCKLFWKKRYIILIVKANSSNSTVKLRSITFFITPKVPQIHHFLQRRLVRWGSVRVPTLAPQQKWRKKKGVSSRLTGMYRWVGGLEGRFFSGKQDHQSFIGGLVEALTPPATGSYRPAPRIDVDFGSKIVAKRGSDKHANTRRLHSV